MFMKTIAVGPLDPAEFCVTGGVCIVARHLAAWVALFGKGSGDAPTVVRSMLLESIVADCRKAILTVFWQTVEMLEAVNCFSVSKQR